MVQPQIQEDQCGFYLGLGTVDPYTDPHRFAKEVMGICFSSLDVFRRSVKRL